MSFDELDGLHYLAPKDVVGEQTLSIRVVSLDGGDGATVAMLELSIPGVEIPKIATIDGDHSTRDASAATDHAVTARLRAELAEVKAAHAAQDAMLVDVRQALESEWEARTKQTVQSEIASARTAWDAEAKAKLAEIFEQNAANLEQSRRTWQAEQDSRLAKMELEAARHLEHERERWRKEFDAELAQVERATKESEAARLAAEDKLRVLASKGETYERARSEFEADLAKSKAAWKESEAARFAEAEAQWQLKAATLQTQAHDRLRREFETDLLKVRKAWQESEAARMAEAEASWRARTEKAVAEATERAIKEAEAIRAKAQVEWKAAEEARLSEAQASWQQQSAKAVAEIRARAEKDLQTAVETAQRAWKASEVARFAAAETRWREESAKLISEARERASGGEKSGDDAQVNRLQDELVAANAARVNREAELAQLRQSLDEASDNSRKKLEQAVSDARKAWSEEEAARSAAAEQKWREQSAKNLSEVQSRHMASASDGASELKQLQAELSAAKAASAERESELMRVRSEAQVQSERQRLENEAALVEAKKAWSAEEQGRLTALEEKWREQMAAQERPVAEVQPQPDVSVATSDEPARDTVEILRLRSEVERLKSKMAIREAELAGARASAEQARARLTGEPTDLLSRQHSDRILLSTGRTRTLSAPSQKKNMPWRDIGIVAAIAVVIFLFYPQIISLLPSDWFSDSSYSDDVDPTPPRKPVTKPAPIPNPPTDIVIKSANVRAAPSKSATLVSTLGANVTVRTLERRGSWAHIEFTVGAVKQDGWVFSTFLQALQTPAAAPPPVSSN